MSSIPELEKKWIKYKIKSFIPHIGLSIVLIIILPLVIVFHYSKKPNDEISKIAEQNSNKIEPFANLQLHSLI